MALSSVDADDNVCGSPESLLAWEGARWLEEHPAASQDLLDLLTGVVIEYLDLQAQRGAQLLQVFEAMGMQLPPHLFEAPPT